MINPSQHQQIKEIVEEFFGKTGFNLEIEVKKPETSTIFVDIKMDEPRFLIGEGGQTLAEVQSLLKTILRKKIQTEEPFYLNLDINDYKKKKAEYLKELARNTANDVALTKKEAVLAAMPAYERRVIHLELAGRSDVVTESIGQEPERKVVIRAYP